MENERTETHACDCISRRKAFEYFVTLWECIGTIMDRDEWEDVCMTTANEIPSTQPNLQPTCNRLATDCISRQAAIDFIDAGHLCNPNEPRWSDNEIVNFLKSRPSAQPEIIRCGECKHWMPYEWMFGEIWRSQNIYDYSADEIGCEYGDMTMKAYDFCSRAERREG